MQADYLDEESKESRRKTSTKESRGAVSTTLSLSPKRERRTNPSVWHFQAGYKRAQILQAIHAIKHRTTST